MSAVVQAERLEILSALCRRVNLAEDVDLEGRGRRLSVLHRRRPQGLAL